MEIAGKHVMVTGGTKRVGRAMVDEMLYKQGARVSCHYYESTKPAFDWKALADKQHLPAFIFQADLRDKRAIQRGVTEATQALGPVSVLINSASAFFPTPALEVTEAEWELFMQVNARGQFYFAQACAPSMLAQKAGVILNLTDVYTQRVVSHYSPYLASKAALESLTKALAKEWAPWIRVNSLAPGPILPAIGTPPGSELVKKAISKTLLGRMGTPEDLVSAALMLIENDYITGTSLAVDGGRELATF